MKTYRNLYPQIYAFENLFLAWEKAKRGKRYSNSAAQFEINREYELIKLQDELVHESYQCGGYRSFTIHEPKRRKISAAPFADRVVHHALCNVIGPIFERQFIPDSYANRVGKGTHRALDRCTYFMRRYPYVLQCDVQQFFPAIDHQILKNILAKTIADTETLTLCGKIIDSGVGILNEHYQMRYFPGDDLLATLRPRGLPVGNLTSQFWANVYLNPLDHYVKRELKCRAYVRYVDDFLLFGENKPMLHQWKAAIIEFLHSLRLTLHATRAQPRPVQQGIPFLGFTMYPNYRRLKRSKGIYYRRRILGLYQQYQQGFIERSQLDSSVRAWVGHVMHGDTWGLRTHLFSRLIL